MRVAHQDFDRAWRREVSIPGTLRTPDAVCDVAIHDLSTTGFSASLPASLEIGLLVSIGASSLGRRDARVVWSSNERHGFTFEQPISIEDVAQAKSEANVVSVDFAAGDAAVSGETTRFPEPVVRHWPRAWRLGFILLAGAAAWGLAIRGFHLF